MFKLIRDKIPELAKKDTIKALGFRWDSKTKQWYKQLSNAA